MHSKSTARQLRDLIARPGIVPTLAPHDVFSAWIMQQAGLECLFLGGFGTSASMLGLPDLNFLTAVEMADAIRRTTARLSIPVIADADTGHGDLLQIRRTVELFESAGAAGLLLEDQVMPKRCGHFRDKAVVSSDEFLARIKTALQARKNPDFVIFARTDSRESHGLDEAIQRINRCAEIGADAGFIEAPHTVEELREIPRRVQLPMLANMLTGGKTPIVPVPELGKMGYKWAVAPVESLMVCARAVQDLTRSWISEGRVDQLAGEACSFSALKNLLEVDRFLDGAGPVAEGKSPSGKA